jgi:ABC-type multidrug transport system fused ATPase/permease subunit
LVQEAINEVIKDRTSVVIAHRLSTVRHADTIAVLERGRLVEQGTLEELLKQEGRFASYWKEQHFL